MRRREFITLLGGAAAWPLAARAQSSKMHRIGILHSASGADEGAFQQGLRETGFIEGQNVLIEYRRAMGVYERLPSLAAELVGLSVDLIAALGTPAVRAAKSMSTKSVPAIPVVFVMGSDPVSDGFVESLDRPGGNMTGVTVSRVRCTKRLDLAREFLRDDAAIALLINPIKPPQRSGTPRCRSRRSRRWTRLDVLMATDQAEIDEGVRYAQAAQDQPAHHCRSTHSITRRCSEWRPLRRRRPYQ